MRRSTVFLFFLGSIFATAQEFEVASVKTAGPERDGPTAYRLGPGTDDPERITFERQSMLRLLNVAYGLDFDQISGPAWLATEYYSVDAKVPPGTTKEQVKLMWQNLLEERFHLKAHFTSKEFPAWELTVAKSGPKLRKSGEGAPKLEPGFPVLAAGSRHGVAMAPPRNVRQTFHGYTMAEFCQQLAWTVSPEGQSGWLGYASVARVVDKTGLDGTYDFTLEFAGRLQSGAYPPPLPDGESDTAPYLFDALRQQLGLQLEERKSKLDVLVVDHVDRVPTEN
jgi:uncharacterized protein (TIGR03435 family)